MKARLKDAEQKAAKAKKAEADAPAEAGADADQLRQEALQLAKDLARHIVPDPPQLFCEDITSER